MIKIRRKQLAFQSINLLIISPILSPPFPAKWAQAKHLHNDPMAFSHHTNFNWIRISEKILKEAKTVQVWKLFPSLTPIYARKRENIRGVCFSREKRLRNPYLLSVLAITKGEKNTIKQSGWGNQSPITNATITNATIPSFHEKPREVGFMWDSFLLKFPIIYNYYISVHNNTVPSQWCSGTHDFQTDSFSFFPDFSFPFPNLTFSLFPTHPSSSLLLALRDLQT